MDHNREREKKRDYSSREKKSYIHSMLVANITMSPCRKKQQRACPAKYKSQGTKEMV